MSALDEKLFACHTTATGYHESEWQEMLAHVIRKLEVFLEQPVEVHHVDFNPTGFAADLSSSGTFSGALKVSWFGRIGANVVGDNEATVVQAFLFLHGAGKRLVAIDGSAYLWLHYEKLENGESEWAMKWQDDEFGEFVSWGTEPMDTKTPAQS